MKPAYAPLIFGARKISPLIAATVFPAAGFLCALLLTESLPDALWACCACAACVTITLTGSLARDKWLERKGRRLERAVAAELAVRKRMGMPPGHPEHVTRYLSNKDEGKLAWLRQDTWPDWEYKTIIAEHRARWRP